MAKATSYRDKVEADKAAQRAARDRGAFIREHGFAPEAKKTSKKSSAKKGD